MSKQKTVLKALYAYANAPDLDSPCDHQEAIDLTIEFLEAFAGLDMSRCVAPSGKVYSYTWLLEHMQHAFGSCPAHVHIQFLNDLGLLRTDLLTYEDDEEQPNLPGVADT